MSHWRKTSERTIAQVLAENKGKSPDELLVLVRAAYPFGERAHHPYKVWLACVRATFRVMKRNPEPAPEGQPSLFEMEKK